LIPLVDTHAHIQDSQFGADLGAVLQRARAAGLRGIVVPGVDSDSSNAAHDLAERDDLVFATAGYHPHEASRLDPGALQHIETLLSRPRVVAVGEIGLDFYRMHSPRKAQVTALERMLELASRHVLPVIVHCRDAQETLQPILASWSAEVRSAFAGRPLGVMHYFAGTPAEALDYVEMGFMISVHTSVSHPRAANLRDVAAATPLDALVVETDSPYGAPQAYRGKRNEPSYVVEAAVKIGEVRQTNVETVARATTANACRLFRLPLPEFAGLRTGAAI
jgi:TatD DNase family protein